MATYWKARRTPLDFARLASGSFSTAKKPLFQQPANRPCSFCRVLAKNFPKENDCFFLENLI
jgi:hypothetical protein